MQVCSNNPNRKLTNTENKENTYPVVKIAAIARGYGMH